MILDFWNFSACEGYCVMVCSTQGVDSLYYGMYLWTWPYCRILAIGKSSIKADIYCKIHLLISNFLEFYFVGLMVVMLTL